MKDILLKELCKSCETNLTLMGSTNVQTNKPMLVKRCLVCGQHPVEEVIAISQEGEVIINPYYRNNKIDNLLVEKQFIKSVNMYDRVIYTRHEEDIEDEAIVKFISQRGVNVSTNWGDRFIKWYHIKRIHKM
jgi:hypothetical protein